MIWCRNDNTIKYFDTAEEAAYFLMVTVAYLTRRLKTNRIVGDWHVGNQIEVRYNDNTLLTMFDTKEQLNDFLGDRPNNYIITRNPGL